jgi:hypothetical protein
MHPTLYHLLAQDRLEELRRQARPAPGDRTDRALGPPATKRTRLSLRGGTS